MLVGSFHIIAFCILHLALGVAAFFNWAAIVAEDFLLLLLLTSLSITSAHDMNFMGQRKSFTRIMFDKHDADGSGSISPDEFRAMAYELGHFMNDEEFAFAIATIDADGSGEIGYDEFKAFWGSDKRFAGLQLDDEQMAIVKQIGDYFRYFDKDNSGDLDTAEFQAMYAHMIESGYALKEYASALSELDRDGSGTINFNEYMAWMMAMNVLDFKDTQPVAMVQ